MSSGLRISWAILWLKRSWTQLRFTICCLVITKSETCPCWKILRRGTSPRLGRRRTSPPPGWADFSFRQLDLVNAFFKDIQGDPAGIRPSIIYSVWPFLVKLLDSLGKLLGFCGFRFLLTAFDVVRLPDPRRHRCAETVGGNLEHADREFEYFDINELR